MKFKGRVVPNDGGQSRSGNDGVIADFGGKKRRLSRRQTWIVVATLFVVLFGVLIGTLVNSSLFAISNVRIVIHGKLITGSEVLAFTDSIKGSNYFNVDVEKVAKNFDSDPNVGTATVTKTFPNTVTITLESATASFAVLSNFSTLNRIALNDRGQTLASVTPPATLPMICTSRVQVFSDSATDFSCAQTTKVADVQAVLSRIKAIISNWSITRAKILSIYVFTGYGVGIQDSLGDLVYYANANSVANSSVVLSRIIAGSTLPRPFLIDLSNLKSPFYLPVPSFKG